MKISFEALNEESPVEIREGKILEVVQPTYCRVSSVVVGDSIQSVARSICLLGSSPSLQVRMLMYLISVRTTAVSIPSRLSEWVC